MKRLLKMSIWIGNVSAALVLVAYIYLWVSTVTVVNRSGRLLTNLSARISEKTFWQGNVPVNGSRWALGFVEHKGFAEITYLIDGRDKRVDCGYFTGGPISAWVLFTVKADGEPTCRYNYRPLF